MGHQSEKRLLVVVLCRVLAASAKAVVVSGRSEAISTNNDDDGSHTGTLLLLTTTFAYALANRQVHYYPFDHSENEFTVTTHIQTTHELQLQRYIIIQD